MPTVPVYNIVSLFCADDAEGVDSCICRCQVGVLSWAPRKTPCRTLTASQKLAHTRKEKKKEAF